MPGAAQALDAEFLFLLSLLRPVFAALPLENREQAHLWLERLCQVPALVDSARRDRNEYLCRLYHGIMANKLDAVFLDEPPEGALRPAQDVFPDEDLTSWLNEAGGGADDLPDRGCGDADERTYLATQVLPGGRGAYGYLAVSLAKGGPHWVSSANESGWRPGEPQATSTPLVPTLAQQAQQPSPSQQAAGPSERVDDLLVSRPSADQRQHLMKFYDSLISDLEQAMAEPEKTSPELEKLISSFQDSSTSVGSGVEVSSRQRELLSSLHHRLEERRERAMERSQLLDSLEQQGMTPPSHVADHVADQPLQDEDDVWNIRPENVALLEAAYPRQLVKRFLDAVVRERVAVLGRVRARRFCQHHVEGLEDDAAEDMEHYRDSTAAWVGLLRDFDNGQGAAADTANQADKCADLATRTMEVIRELGAARRRYFQREEEQRELQDHLRAEIEVLRGEEAQLKRRAAEALYKP